MSENTFKPLGEVVGAFQDKMDGELEAIGSSAGQLTKACSEIEDSWSGSFAGWHGRMYFRDFAKPALNERFNGEWGGIRGIPEGWQEKDAKVVASRISKIVGRGFSVENFEDRIKSARAALDDFKADVDVELSLIEPSIGVEERKLVSALRDFSFGETRGHFVKTHLPGTIITRDMEAMRQGTCIPTWLYYASVAYEGSQIAESSARYRKQMERFVKQATARNQLGKEAGIARPAFYGIHPEIQQKCATLYEAGTYAEAVEKSFKVVRDRLRTLTGHETGSDAFGKTKLHIRGAAAAHVDDDFNQAVKFLAMAIDRFRNEKSHTSDAKIQDPVRAYQYLTMSSLAMYLLKEAEIRP